MTMQTHWIDGRAVTDKGESIAVLNPATEDPIDDIPRGGVAVAEQAVAAARRAFVGWAGRSVIERRNAIRKATEKLAALREEVAVLLTREMGKPLAQSARRGRQRHRHDAVVRRTHRASACR